jgi:hypothetical protein
MCVSASSKTFYNNLTIFMNLGPNVIALETIL